MAKKRLIPLIILASISIAFTTSCASEKTEEEKNSENEIRKLLQYDANINIDKYIVLDNGFKLDKEIEGDKYLLSFRTTKYRSAGRTAILVDHDIVTYSVDKNTYYDFSENYSTTETQKEVDMVRELTFSYNPIKVITAGNEVETTKGVEQ